MSEIKSPKLVLSQVLDLPAAVAGFYIQEAVMTEVNFMNETPMKIRLQDEIAEFRSIYQKYSDRLAGAFFDYIALACFGEARHALTQAKKYIPQICYKWNRDNAKENIRIRNKSYQHALKFDPYTFLPTLEELFNYGHWRDAYGGGKWANIAGIGTLYRSLTSQVFIDHAVDLSHNSGSMFSKDVLFKKYAVSRYLDMLNKKQYSPSILKNYEFFRIGPIAANVKPFLKLAVKLGLVQSEIIYICNYIPIVFPETIKWGLLPITVNDILQCNLHGIDIDDKEEGEEENHDDSPITFDSRCIMHTLKPNLDKLSNKLIPSHQTSMF